MRSIIFIFITFILFGVSGCQKDYVKLNDDEIKEYISKNNIDAKRTTEGLYYVVNEEGSSSYKLIPQNGVYARSQIDWQQGFGIR